MPCDRTALRRTAGALIRVALVLSLATGCSSMRRVAPGEGGFREGLRRGDALRVVRSDGRVLEGYAVAVTEGGIAVEPDRRDSLRGAARATEVVVTAWPDVVRVDRYQLSPGRTVVAVGAAAIAAAVIVFSGRTADAWRAGASLEHH